MLTSREVVASALLSWPSLGVAPSRDLKLYFDVWREECHEVVSIFLQLPVLRNSQKLKLRPEEGVSGLVEAEQGVGSRKVKT